MSLEIVQYPTLDDNYNYLLHCPQKKETIALDPSEAKRSAEEIKKRNWHLNALWITHHHWDHISGIESLVESYKCPVYCSQKDRQRIPHFTHTLKDGDEIKVGETSFKVLEFDGHTQGHIAFWQPDEGLLFSGDTLFSMGCGRLFEGHPERFYKTLERLRSLPDQTLIYGAHEYTLANGAFALSIEPGNLAIQQQLKEAQRLRSLNKPTVPTPLKLEKQINPFLRWDSPEIRKHLQMERATNVEVFIELRQRKDQFKGTAYI